MSEYELIEQCQNGKLDFFSELYTNYVDKIYKFVYIKTSNQELAEDLTSQTFLKALDKIDTFKNTPESSFKAWIYRIAYNLIIDTYKTKKETVSIDEFFDIGYDTHFGEHLDQKDALQKVFEYFNTLKEKQKQMVLLRIWHDLSYQEIAEITGENVLNCRKIVSRVLAKIPENILWFLLVAYFLTLSTWKLAQTV